MKMYQMWAHDIIVGPDKFVAAFYKTREIRSSQQY